MGGIFSLLIVLIMSSLVYAQGEGFTVTSVSTSEVISKSTDPTKTYWIINTQLSGGGQAIAGAINPEDIKRFTGGKYTTKQPISIEVKTSNEQIFYNVINEGVPIYKYSLTTTEGPVNCPLNVCYVAADAPACSANTGWDIPVGKSFWGKVKKRFCIEKTQAGIKGVYDNPTVTFNANILLKVGSITKVKTICSGAITGCDGSSISFDDVGTATWSGSLVTGESAPNQNNYVAIKRLDSNTWQIARRSTYDSYFPKIDDADQKLNSVQNTYAGEQDPTKAEREIKDAITPVNNAGTTLLGEDTSFTSSPFTKDSNTGKVTVTLDRKLTSPNLVFRLRADWLGIVIPAGQPKILSITADKFNSGETGIVRVQLQNTGEVQGTFSAMLVGCEPFIQSTTTQSARKTILPGDIDEITIPVSGGSLSEDTLKTCTVKVYEVNEPSIETTSSVDLQLEKAKVCVPNRVFADGNIIKRCNKDGSAIEVVKKCKYGVESDGKGGLVCSINPGEKAKYECIEDSDCETDAICNIETHSCEIPSDITSDVLIVTLGGKLDKTDAYKKTLNEYRDVLKKEGLSSFYIELDSPKIKSFFNVELKDPTNWREVKSVLDKILDKTKSKYLLILGGVNVIPQPPAKTTAEIPAIPTSDDRYSDLDLDGIPDIAVGRIPTPDKSTSIIVSALKSAIIMHNKDSLSKVMLTDVCLFPPSCSGINDVNLISTAIFGVNCYQTDDCYSAPPYCSGNKCERRENFYLKLLNSDIINLNAHANPYSFSAATKDGWYDVLTSKILYKTPFLTNPVFSTIGCHSGTIDCGEGSCINKDGNVFAFLANGASNYVGNTRYGFGGGATSSLLSDYYNNLKKGQRSGDALLNMKRAAIKGSHSEWWKAVVYEVQLYGDPTLKINME